MSKILNTVQEEINLLVKQTEIVSRLEESKLRYYSNDYMLMTIEEKLSQIYPTYLELREKYLTNE